MIEADEYRLQVAERAVVLTPPTPALRICDSSWLIMNTRGFASEAEALDFGRTLRTALQVSAVAARIGVDTGRDLATSALGRTVREHVRQQTGSDVRPNVHGVDVFPDDPNTRIFAVTATGTVRARPDPFLSDLDELHTAGVTPSAQMADVILLMNYALMQPEPVAQIVFAVSAVESLGQDETWTIEQRSLLKDLAVVAEQSTRGSLDERREVADALRKSLHRLTLRQGVFRLLDRLALGDLKTSWDDLYAERSTLVHGLAPKPGADDSDLGHRTVSLCGRILLTAVATELPMVKRHIATLYAQ
jgi:hypothetical protein